MKMYVYSVLDAKAASYSYPFVAQNNALAIRMFEQTALDQNSMIYKYPEDYTLVVIGTFDDNTGEVEPVKIDHVAKGTDFFALTVKGLDAIGEKE